METADKILRMAVRHPRLWVLTGAGISTESGIPDFRSPGSGMWEKVDPMEVFSVEGLARNPRLFYVHGMAMFDGMIKAEANIAHRVLGLMQQWGLLGPVVTQNIDNLHQKGGAFWVYEVHGHIRTATCMGCGRTTSALREVLDRVAAGREVPRCPHCHSLLKPDVILFGDAMPVDYINARLLKGAYRHHTLPILVVGSSLVVSPINAFPAEFDHLAIINNDQTMLDYRARILWREQAGGALEQILAAIEKNTGTPEPGRLPYGFLPGSLIGDLIDKCLDQEGNPRALKPGEEKQAVARALLWRETLEDYLAKRSANPLATMVCRLLLEDLERISSRCQPGGTPLTTVKDQVLRQFPLLVQDHFNAAETALRSGLDNQPAREVLLGSAFGMLGWYRHLSRQWGITPETMEALVRRPLELGYGSNDEIASWLEEF